MTVLIEPATPERWPDLEKVFGGNGAYGGCWCMWPRMRSSEFRTAKAAENKAGLRARLDSTEPPGIIAYVDGEPAGWCSIDRRQNYRMLERSRRFPPVDDQPVWTIMCFVIRKGFRRRGLMSELLQGAIAHVRERGGRIIEGYPVEPGGNLKSFEGYTGIVSTFQRAGFCPAHPAVSGRPVMRLEVAAP